MAETLSTIIQILSDIFTTIPAFNPTTSTMIPFNEVDCINGIYKMPI